MSTRRESREAKMSNASASQAESARSTKRKNRPRPETQPSEVVEGTESQAQDGSRSTATLGDDPKAREAIERVAPSTLEEVDGPCVIPMHPPLRGHARSFSNRKRQHAIGVSGLRVLTGNGDGAVSILLDLGLLTPASGADRNSDEYEEAQKILGKPCLVDFAQQRLVLHIGPHELDNELERLAANEHLAHAVLTQLCESQQKRALWEARRALELETFDLVCAGPAPTSEYVAVGVPTSHGGLPVIMVAPIGSPTPLPATAEDLEPGRFGELLGSALSVMCGSLDANTIAEMPNYADLARQFRDALAAGLVTVTLSPGQCIFQVR